MLHFLQAYNDFDESFVVIIIMFFLTLEAFWSFSEF